MGEPLRMMEAMGLISEKKIFGEHVLKNCIFTIPCYSFIHSVSSRSVFTLFVTFLGIGNKGIEMDFYIIPNRTFWA